MYEILIILLGASLVISMAMWCSHVSMNINEHLPYDFVTFKTFLKEFEKYKDDPELDKSKLFKGSIFLEKDKVYIMYLHANIVKFNNKCMIFYPFSYIRYCLWKKKFTHKPKPKYRVKGLWKENLF